MQIWSMKKNHMWISYTWWWFLFLHIHVVRSIHPQNFFISRDNPAVVHNTWYEESYGSVQSSRSLCAVTEEGRWRKRGETDEAERWQARRVTWRRRFEVTGPTLKQEVSTSARLSHQRCMPAWQTLRMFLWDKVHTGWLVEAASLCLCRWETLDTWPRRREDFRRILSYTRRRLESLCQHDSCSGQFHQCQTSRSTARGKFYSLDQQKKLNITDISWPWDLNMIRFKYIFMVHYAHTTSFLNLIVVMCFIRTCFVKQQATH